MALVSAAAGAGNINVSAFEVAEAARSSRPLTNAEEVSQTARQSINGTVGSVSDIGRGSASALGLGSSIDMLA